MNRVSKYLYFLLPIILTAILFLLGKEFLSETCELDQDEGINLSKSLLISSSYTFFKQIQSDQPPLFNYILSLFIDTAGHNLLKIRLFVSTFSILIILAFWKIIKQHHSPIKAAVATLCLITSWYYARLSFSIMIGFPALSLALISVQLLIGKKQTYRAFLAGICFALSLHIKIITLIIAPTLIIILYSKRGTKHYLPFLWGLLLVYISLFFIFDYPTHLKYLFFPHFGITNDFALATFRQITLENLYNVLPHIILYLPLLLVGIYKTPRKNIPAIAWLLTSLTFIAIHRPIQYHHLVFLMIPIIWISSSCFCLVKPCSRYIVLLLFICIFTTQYALMKRRKVSFCSQEIISRLHADSQAFVFSDRPIYAFLAKKLIPPELVVFSYKRINSTLTWELFKSTTEKRGMQTFVIERFSNFLNDPGSSPTKFKWDKFKTYFNSTKYKKEIMPNKGIIFTSRL